MLCRINLVQGHHGRAAAMTVARGQTILTSGASQGTQSGRALDAGRGVYPYLMLNGVRRDGFALGLNFYSLPSCPESSSRYRLRKAVRAARQAFRSLVQPLVRAAETSVRQ